MDDLLTPDACTLPTAQRPVRLAEFDDLFRESVTRVERFPDLVRLSVSGASGVLDRTRDLTARESACCSFFDFTVSGDDADGLLEVRVPPAQAPFLEALADRAEELSR